MSKSPKKPKDAAESALDHARQLADDAARAVADLTSQHRAATAETRHLVSLRDTLLGQHHKPGSKAARKASGQVAALDAQISEARTRARSIEAALTEARAEHERAVRQVELMRASPAAADAATKLATARATAATIAGKQRAARVKADALATERSQLALPAHVGDAGARQRLDEVHREIAIAASESASLDAAAAEAGRLVQAAQAELEEAEHARATLEAENLVSELLAASQRADGLARELTDVLRQRSTILRQIDRTGAFPIAAVRGLQRGFVVASALRQAGLGQHTDIPGTGAGRALADADAAMSRSSSTPTNENAA